LRREGRRGERGIGRAQQNRASGPALSRAGGQAAIQQRRSTQVSAVAESNGSGSAARSRHRRRFFARGASWDFRARGRRPIPLQRRTLYNLYGSKLGSMEPAGEKVRALAASPRRHRLRTHRPRTGAPSSRRRASFFQQNLAFFGSSRTRRKRGRQSEEDTEIDPPLADRIRPGDRAVGARRPAGGEFQKDLDPLGRHLALRAGHGAYRRLGMVGREGSLWNGPTDL